MTFQPQPGTPLSIEGKIYKIAEHPTAKGVPYGQEGRRAIVYQLLAEDGEKFALKVFKDRFRVPGMVSVAEFLEPYVALPGLQVCERIVLTASRHRVLLTQYPELTYAVLMPWVEGSTWQEILLSEEDFSQARALSMAKNFADILVNLEEKRLAHCDISGANLIIQAGDQPALVDLEEMYNPDFIKPESLPAGSPGYAHKTAPKGLWDSRSDRFAGAVMLVEMLCWHDRVVREASWGESYFSPRDMQNENQRLDLLRRSLERHYGKRILDLFNQVWLSDSLRDCPTFAEWVVALPEEVHAVPVEDLIEKTTPSEAQEPQALMIKAQNLADSGELTLALDLYLKAIVEAPQEMSGEIEKQIAALEKRIRAEQSPSKVTRKDKSYPVRPCPDCGKVIPEGQEICSHCEGVPTQKEQAPKKSRKKLSGMLFSAAAIISISVAAFFMRDKLVALFPEETIMPSATPLNTPASTTGTVIENLELNEIVDSLVLDSLINVIVPINDPIDIAQRLEGKEDIPLTLPVEDLDLPIGTQKNFWVTDTDTAENFQIETTLEAATDHLYFWIENGVEYTQSALDNLVADFEDNIYPTNREFFGSEWFPGVDQDPHLYVIYARGLGFNLAGYYNSTDEYHPDVYEFSNAHETFMLSADNAGLRDGYTYGVLAHEFQHMIHWYRDRNETSWLNEGFSELATLLTGHREGPTHDYYFADDPDTQLNDWPNDPNATIPHYGNAFLFVTYFMDRFGSEATKALVADEHNGLPSVDQVLQDLNITDPATGMQITADDVFLDWVMTNYLNNEYNVADRFKYISYPDVPNFYATEEIDECSTGEYQRDVHQYAADYIKLNCGENFTINFSGQQSVQVLPEDPYSGNYAFWSNKGDQSDMSLTREFDFRDQTGTITFNYHLWYDLEEDYDYVFLEISTDGQDWRILRTPSSTSEDPSGNSYGWGYNGLSGGNGTWIEETVDLSSYAGELVQLRFEYITDAAVHGEGLLLDDVSVPEIDYSSDFESDEGGWIAEGFVRIRNSLPQTYRLALIHLDAIPTIEFISVQTGDTIEIPVEADASNSGKVVLVVTGTTRFTRQKALYWLELEQE